jgi:hypothetical protein
VTIDIEDRLRADLPGLAELIASEPVDELAPAVAVAQRPHRRSRTLVALLAACVAIGGATVAVVRHHTSAKPAVVVDAGHGHATTTVPGVSLAGDRWRALPPSPLGPRGNTVTVWTGTEVLVWGGYRGEPTAPLAFQSGAAFNPTTGTWRKIADNQWGHPGALGVWAGDRLYVLAKNGGAAYDPGTDSWHDVAPLPGDGGFVAVAWTGTQLLGVVIGDTPGTIAVATYDPAHDTWSIGPPVRAPWQQTIHRASTAWTGSELVMTDGTRSVWAYDPNARTWHTLPPLAGHGVSSSVSMVKGALVAVYADWHGLHDVVSTGGKWEPVALDAGTSIVDPIAIDAGGTLVAIDRAGQGQAERADADAGRWVPLGRTPIAGGANGTAVWTGTGLFVWGGLPAGTAGTFPDPTPRHPDAVWFGAPLHG